MKAVVIFVHLCLLFLGVAAPSGAGAEYGGHTRAFHSEKGHTRHVTGAHADYTFVADDDTDFDEDYFICDDLEDDEVRTHTGGKCGLPPRYYLPSLHQTQLSAIHTYKARPSYPGQVLDIYIMQRVLRL